MQHGQHSQCSHKMTVFHRQLDYHILSAADTEVENSGDKGEDCCSHPQPEAPAEGDGVVRVDLGLQFQMGFGSKHTHRHSQQ